MTLRAARREQDVVVEVEDNGPGIPPEAQRRVFDAFYTTKPPGQGTGLGLQISYRIVVFEHRGDLAFETQPGRTTFRVTLPIQGHKRNLFRTSRHLSPNEEQMRTERGASYTI